MISESQPTSYIEAKFQQLDELSTFRIYGHTLEVEQGSVTARQRRWSPIIPCFCVQDSPQNPCRCMTAGERWWLPDDAIIAHGNSGRKDHHGKELQFFDVLVSSKIMIESLQLVNVNDLKNQRQHNISLEKILELVATTEGGDALGTIQKSVDWKAVLIQFASALVVKYFDDLIKPIPWPPRPS